jgi:NAD(P)-dependent dehydrogenase (short-subunit alcohol dehydrogenase family)
MPAVHRQRPAVVANLSARVGSIGDNRLGGWYSYRASKAAINQLTKCAALEFERRKQRVAAILLHPGTVDTDLSKPFQRVSGGKCKKAACTAAGGAVVVYRVRPAGSRAVEVRVLGLFAPQGQQNSCLWAVCCWQLQLQACRCAAGGSQPCTL